MPNHYHLLIRLTFPMLRPFAAVIQQSYAQYHHRRHGTCGVLWQGRHQTRAVEEDLCLTRCGRYIERNPVRAGLAEFAWDWPHSSAGFYVLGRRSPVLEFRCNALFELDLPITSPVFVPVFAPGRPCVSASLRLCANVCARVWRRGAATRRGNRRASAVGPATNGEVSAAAYERWIGTQHSFNRFEHRSTPAISHLSHCMA
jgi:hypothetical protein